MQCYQSKNIPKYMVNFIEFTMSRLGLDKLRGEIEIHLSRDSLEEEAYGLCWGDRREVEIHIASKQWGDSLTRKEKLMSIAHELTHAHQYLTGRLKCNDDKNSIWLGESYEYCPELEATMPWEQEARTNERVIYKEWMGINSSRG